MSKGTILYIGGFELPDKNAAAHRVLSIGKIFRDLDYSVVYLGIDKDLECEAPIGTTNKIIQGFQCYAQPYPKTNKQWISYLTKIYSFLEISQSYPDLRAVVCYNFPAVPFKRIRNYCHKNNLKIFGDCTEWYSTQGSGLGFKVLKGLDGFFRMRVIQKQLDGLILVSDYLADYYKNQKNIVLPPLVDLSEDKWKQEKPGFRVEKIKLVYAGDAGRNKDQLDILIEVLFALKDKIDFRCTIIGVSYQEYVAEHKNQIHMISQLGDKVEFSGRLTHLQCLAVIKSADFSIFLRESNRVANAGFPTKFTESVSCGTPVITNATSDLSKFMVEGKNGWFVNNSGINSLENQLLEVLSLKPDEIQAMKDYCYRFGIFDYRNFIDQVSGFLK
ncbi:MAG: glycosyltransferase [Erysipelotrichaceae bacterium]